MAIDGSFCIESALRRFLARCPELGRAPQFVALTAKINAVTEEEVVNSVAELFVHPHYTIPLLGCFRPIARRILEKTVALLRLVPNLRSNSNSRTNEVGYSFDDAVANIIDSHSKSGLGLDLHELACRAFSRALDLAPYLLGNVLSFFQFAPPPFGRFLVQHSAYEQSPEAAVVNVLDAARTSYRFFLMEAEIFSKLWDWSCFIDLVQWSLNLDLSTNEDFAKKVLDIRWCAIRILSVAFKDYDVATPNLGLGAEESLSCFLRWKEYCQDVSLEKAGWYLDSNEQKQLERNVAVDLDHENCLRFLSMNCLAVSPSQHAEIEPLSGTRRSAHLAGDPFTMTSTVKKSFEIVLLAVSQKWPVLLYGSAGAGKTALIRKLARESRNRVLSIHMDDQIDSKTLVGSYVCTEKPGEFRWQPGSLTQAVVNGFWVVLEDIDKAPTDVLSVLLPLLEGASSFATGYGEAIRVAESFRLFSTISSFTRDVSRGIEGNYFLGVLWRRVRIGHSSMEDLHQIVKAWYPDLEPLAEKLLETFESVKVASENPSYSCSISRFSLRDLLKWCKRISSLGFSFKNGSLSAYERNCIYREAVDIFAAFSTSVENRLTIMKDIARMWAVPASEADTLYPLNKPIIQDFLSESRIGRISLQRTQATLRSEKKPFVGLRTSLHALERIACSVKFNEPVLLVGETGTGKTTLVQNLALRIGQKLTVMNLSQQTDVADLLGGFKPMDAQFVCFPLYKEFARLFLKTFPAKDNSDFLTCVQKHLSNKNWKKLLSGFKKGVDSYRKAVDSYQKSEAVRLGSGKKRKKLLDEQVQRKWEEFTAKLEAAHDMIVSSSGMLFSFVEGAFVTALRNGEWILLDEVNLAPPETLQRIIGVLEGENGSFCLAERGDINYIQRHPNFRIFACMNPATDAGKRDLPYSLRSRFTEYFVDDVMHEDDLTLFINQFMDDSHSNRDLVNNIVQFYKEAKKESDERKLQDGANQKPQYSLRSLYRALEYTQKAKRKFGFEKALYDGFSMFFLTLLDRPSAKKMNEMILKKLLGKKPPPHAPFDRYLETSGTSQENYVLTTSVKDQLSNLARAIFIKRYPVLLQGPTSSGKTSLVKYLATITGHKFVRINNHEHTDLQEYLGFYITDAFGKLVFHEGILVEAVRNGYWIVLDELNLAPSDVLEALNRLLDDNRELFLPELRETVQAHPNFMLFATQNPPTFYGGRKMLSRAFRNRFMEIHVEEIPENELSTILEKRCKIPESHAKKMVEVMKELQLKRQSSKIFAGKHGFITPRDLFRWANRFRTYGMSYEDCARDGYYLLADRLRNETEKVVVQEILEKHFRVKLVKEDLYKQGSGEIGWTNGSEISKSLGNIAFTQSMQRLLFLVERCYNLREPVILVGETGGGKTTICQLLSIILGLKLHILNCHQYTEASDFLGGFHPIRERGEIASDYTCQLKKMVESNVFNGEAVISLDISRATSTLQQLDIIIDAHQKSHISDPDVTMHNNDATKYDHDALVKMRQELGQLHQKWQTIFTWQDGPLVQAMRDGDLVLVDEISLADDSVLERLNSVLEPERTLSLAEKGESEPIDTHPNFLVLATMNPGGDYGKKELSPALRNRFTEIWVPAVTDINELRSIAQQRISSQLSIIVDPMLTFYEWFNQLQKGRVLTTRDLLSWVAFVNETRGSLQPESALVHGMFLILLDGLSLGTGMSKNEAGELRKECLSFLLGKLKVPNSSPLYETLSRMENYGWGNLAFTPDILCTDMHCDDHFGIHPFFIRKGDEDCEDSGFDIMAPTTRRNSLRVLRAMQVAKPVLLEGSPGVGKTSLIVALGKLSGHRVVRINLSEQTDIMDLLGSDLPVESDEGIKFAWSDGILLQALNDGHWVLLDELNLAPQAVLEGLNAILDHRAEVFIPELGQSYKCHPSFRVFACQNPSSQGGGRKGLPKSFLNRFTKVYVDELVDDDYLSISRSLFPSIHVDLLTKLIKFNKRLHEETMLYHNFAHDGSPWEFNLRDVVRSCQIIQGAPVKYKSECFLSIVYFQRMRTATDRKEVLRLYEQVFGLKPILNPNPRVHLSPQSLIVGNTTITRNNFQSSDVLSSRLKILPGMRNCLEAIAQCVQHQWLCILIGPPSSGKTSLIRLLAQLTGNVLHEINLSPATDISELLGCFEQYDAFRNFRSVVSEVERYVNEYCGLQLEFSVETLMKDSKDLVSRWFTFLSSMNRDGWTGSPTNMFIENRRSISLLLEIIEQLRGFLVQKEQLRSDSEKNPISVSWSFKDLSRIQKTTSKLQEDCQRRPSAKFEWVTGVLIKAIENGEWIVLENANLCNPTVLDRINSLVEPCGSITVNECGTIEGKPMVVHPHSNFRMFLTVNPTFGEVSRAMRNRGVEIFMMQPYGLLEEHDYSHEETERKYLERFVVLSDIPGSNLVDAMVKAHMYAKNEGLQHNLDITYLELARWVQLYQQLITNGNQPMWSLLISWEHTYLSSLGEAEGRLITSRAKETYFQLEGLFDFSPPSSLCLPGSSLMPLTIQDTVLYSKEASVLQNFMYLESLGAQFAPYKFDTSNGMHTGSFHTGADLSDKKLMFASIWTIEQATESDIKLYLLYFSWFSSQVQPLSHFFQSFLTLLEKERGHHIWRLIDKCRQKLVKCPGISWVSGSDKANDNVFVDVEAIPLLSLELVGLTASNSMYRPTSELLHKAIKCIGILRRSFQQWNAEDVYNSSKNIGSLSPFLKSLKVLEENVLCILVESPCFDDLLRLYTNLLEDHISFWNSATSPHPEYLLPFWRFLVKGAMKLQGFCPRAAEVFLMESKNLDRVSDWTFNSQKSMLWIHGGHPSSPFSQVLFSKQQKLLSLCESIWPKKKELKNANENHLLEVVSINPQLRLLAIQGVGMSSHITSKFDEDIANTVQQLEEIYQMLVGRVEHEKIKLAADICCTSLVDNSAVCCTFGSELLCFKSGLDTWQETLPIVDISSSCLDMELLNALSMAVSVGEESHLDLSTVSTLLDTSLNFSMNSSRSPISFVPHQKVLWTLDAWMSLDAAPTKLRGYVLEMWFSWHSSLWNLHPECVKSCSNIDGLDVSLPEMLVCPIRAITVCQILKGAVPIKCYLSHCLKLRTASLNLWQSYLSTADLPDFLLSAARSLFQLIISSHKKSFEADKYSAIQSHFSSMKKNMLTHEDLRVFSSLVASSSHRKLTSLMDIFIGPLLKELYLECSPSELLCNLGKAWLRIGGLRFHLLLQCDELDPAMKYSCKYSQLLDKISLLELEIKVRKECDFLGGWVSTRAADKELLQTLNKLEAERKIMEKKIVFRANPGNFKKLKSEANGFLNLINSSLNLIKNVESMDLTQFNAQVRNWQETAKSFIGRLSDEYPSFIDIVQPVQVAVYEMKLGLSLVLSSVLQKKFLKKVEQENLDLVLQTIYSFIRFPRACSFDSSVNIQSRTSEYPSYSVNFATNVGEIDISLLEKMAVMSRDVSADNTVSQLQLTAAICQNVLVRRALVVANAQLMDNTSFAQLDEIFNQFAGLWMNMKQQAKNREENEAQQFKFKPRVFKIETIFESDISTQGDPSTSESFLEWQEFLSEEQFNHKEKANEEAETLVEEWNFLQENILKKLVHTHNSLFGSVDLSLNAGKIQICEVDRLQSFMESYNFGVGMMTGLEGFSSINLDAKLLPEHLLRLAMEHEKVFVFPRKSVNKYNFYKDSNAPMMTKMVTLLMTLNERALALLHEWEDHPGVQKILDVIEMLLAIPLTTPLSKALSGLQFLFNRAQTLQENGSKFSLSDQMEPIITLASLWKKMEYESWPALLDEVQDEYDSNAGKLWFPLYSVLNRHSTDTEGYDQLTIQSLVEFIQTSSVGEFRRRLHLLCAFHGQISTGICLGSYSSHCHKKNVKILYNIFGYHMQFLPIISEHIQTGLKAIELKIKEILKLCRWDRPESLLSIDNSKSTRQKLKKHIEDFNRVLEQPVMLVLTQNIAQSGVQSNPIKSPNTPTDVCDKNEGMLSPAFDMSQQFEDRCSWYETWRMKIDSSLQKQSEKISKDGEGTATTIRKCIYPYQEEWREMLSTIEDVCNTATYHSEQTWKESSKSRGKRRALSEILKLLEQKCGLSKHKPMFLEDQNKFNESSVLFLQPSFEMQHLLLEKGIPPNGDVKTVPGTLKSMTDDGLDIEWRSANQYYFKSMASVKLLRQICLNFHKDFTLKEVNQTVSFLNHLIAVQQEQREAAYCFAVQLKTLKKCVSSLETLYLNFTTTDTSGSDFSILQNQDATFRCLWQQKQLFDNMCTMMHEECLLLRTVESSHMSSCQSVKAELNEILEFIERFVPQFQKSKELLDTFLLGTDGVIVTLANSIHPCVIPREMGPLVVQNFQAFRKFEDHLYAFRGQDLGRSVKEALLSRFDDIFVESKLVETEFHSSLQKKQTNSWEMGKQANGRCVDLEGSLRHVTQTVRTLSSMCNPSLSGENIPSWRDFFESYVSGMQLDVICDELLKTVLLEENWVNAAENENQTPAFPVGAHLDTLHQHSDLLLKFGEGLLLDFLTVHKSVSIMTHVLANIFAALYSKGYGTPPETEEDDANQDKSQDESGTGIGEGIGRNDVSDQITDPSQLDGTQKKNEDDDVKDEMPSNNVKGIEMEDDFTADAFDVSEDSGGDDDADDNEDSEDEKLDSQMGETGPGSEAVDEKLTNNNEDEDEDPQDPKEKYESGSSVKQNDPGSNELRGKEETGGDDDNDNSEPNPNEAENHNDKKENQDGVTDTEEEEMEDLNMDKDEAFADDTGLKLDEQNQAPEDMEVDEKDAADPVGESDAENLNSEEENKNSVEENMEKGEDSKQIDETSEMENNPENNQEKDTDMKTDAQTENSSEQRNPDTRNDSKPNEASKAQGKVDFQVEDSKTAASEEKWSNSSDIYNDLAPVRGLDSTTSNEMEIMVTDSSEGGKLTDPSNAQLPQHDSSSARKPHSNPFRNIGDAIEEWKERVKVSVDLEGDENEVPEEAVDEDADDYGFVSEHERGTAQALGPATAEQNKDFSGNKPDGDSLQTAEEEVHDEMDIEAQNTETHPSTSYTPTPKPKVDEQVQFMDLEKSPMDDSTEAHGHDLSGSLSDSLVTIKKSYMAKDISQLSELSLMDSDLGKAQKHEPMLSIEEQNNATALWRRYELQTTRLSQELAEQLRLVMEPTLASKLQGDYSTGKRINMRKVIAYIASQFRRDKIWLRRTRPNKRDYQVVIAIDDSRSMTESCCGDVAIESLVTVCRAMSQLEVGDLAVASYGKKGNIKLLHDFDQPFTGEAGAKMISSLTFEQENTVTDQPVVDLLKYLNNMMDTNVANARLPSGQNPLRQLVLIIADGRLHEQGENLKLCVREALSKNRMIALLLLDSQQESIMDLRVASMGKSEDGQPVVTFSKYMDSFPFPYYIVLKDVEALPRTLADLLRQWFELMQSSQD